MTSRRYLPAIFLLFVGSGCAALIYEIVWFQLLQMVIGSSAISLGILLGTFMGGMCVGSLLLPRVISAREHPMRVYAFLELGIGVLGVLLLGIMPLVGSVYTKWAGTGTVGHRAARDRGGNLPAASDRADGRDAASNFALGEGDA